MKMWQLTQSHRVCASFLTLKSLRSTDVRYNPDAGYFSDEAKFDEK